MKKLLLILLCLPMIGFGQLTMIPDANFEQTLINLGYDSGAINGSVYTTNIDTVTYLNISNWPYISDLTGIEDFTALTELVCYNNQLTSLDVSQNTALTELVCYNNQLTSLDVSGATALTSLICRDNQLTSLDVSQNTALTVLRCDNNQITSLDVSQNTVLAVLRCDNNQLTSLEIINNTAITSTYNISANFNPLTTVNFSNNPNLLDCVFNFSNTATLGWQWNSSPLLNLKINNNSSLLTINIAIDIDSVDVKNNTALTILDLTANLFGPPTFNIKSIDASQNPALTYLSCSFVQTLTNLDLSGTTNLTELYCNNNQLTSLDVSQNTALTVLRCDNNQITSLDVSQNTALADFSCNVNYIECLDISSNLVLTNLDCSNNLLEQLNTRNGNFQNMSVDALSNNLTCVEVDNIGTATNNWSFDSFATLTTNCNYTNPCNTSTSIQEQTTDKELLKVTDILGRETKQTNQPLFYIYDDGTVEKRIVIE